MPRFNRNIFALNVTKLAESFLKGLKQSGRRGIRGQNTDAVHPPCRGLRLRGERRGKQRGSTSKERAPVHHSIT
jgi:hypothetical protein